MAINREDLNELMADSARNAVTTSRVELGFNLDYSISSIQQVDEIIKKWGEINKKKPLTEEHIFTICNIYGAYVGEVFRELIGGEWCYDETDPDAPVIMLEYGTNTYAFSSTCFQRLLKDPQVSVSNYFHQAVSNNTQ